MSEGRKPLGKGLSALITNKPTTHSDEDTPVSLYRKALFNAYKDGPLTDEGARMLAHNRQQLGISMQQHEDLKSAVIARIKARREEEAGGLKLRVVKKKKVARDLELSEARPKPPAPQPKPVDGGEQWEKDQEAIKSDLKDIFYRETKKPEKEEPEFEEAPEPKRAQEEAPEDSEDEDEFEVQEDEETVEFEPEDEPLEQPGKEGPGEEGDEPMEDKGASDRNEVLSKVIEYIKQGTKHFANKEYKEALVQYQHVIEIDPHNEKVLKAIEMVKERLAEEQAPPEGAGEQEAAQELEDAQEVSFDEEGPRKAGPAEPEEALPAPPPPVQGQAVEEGTARSPAPEVVEHNEQIKGSWLNEQDSIKSELAGLLSKAKADPAPAPAKPAEKPFSQSPPRPLPTMPPSTSAPTSKPLSATPPATPPGKKIEIEFIREEGAKEPEEVMELKLEEETPEPEDSEPEELEEMVPEKAPVERGGVKKSAEEIQQELEQARLKDGRLKEEAKKAKAELYTKAIAKGQEGNFNEALFLINKLLEVEPEHKDAWNDKGVILWNLGKAQLAVDCYAKARELNQDSLEPLINLGVAYKSMGQTDKALQCYEDALRKDPEIEEVWINKGVLLFQMGRTEDADNSFLAAIKINPNSEEGWGYRAYCLENLGRYEEASTCYDYVLNINPHNEDAKRGKEICAKKIRQTLMKDWIN